MFNIFKKKVQAEDNTKTNMIAAMADGELIDIQSVPDDVFAKKMMGETVAFKYDSDSVILYSPASGTLTALFATKHAFGITMENGVELLVHIGINTVEADGVGFTLLEKKQGDKVELGDPIVEVDIKKLSEKYDMSTMLIVTNSNGYEIDFKDTGYYHAKQKIVN